MISMLKNDIYVLEKLKKGHISIHMSCNVRNLSEKSN